MAKVGFAMADAVVFAPVAVEDGQLEIEFARRVRDPMVSAIEIERVD